LRRNGIEYRRLIMLDLDAPELRRELAVHGRFKADVYNTLGGMLFVESEEWQAKEIAKICKRPVCWFNGARLFTS